MATEFDTKYVEEETVYISRAAAAKEADRLHAEHNAPVPPLERRELEP